MFALLQRVSASLLRTAQRAQAKHTGRSRAAAGTGDAGGGRLFAAGGAVPAVPAAGGPAGPGRHRGTGDGAAVVAQAAPGRGARPERDKVPASPGVRTQVSPAAWTSSSKTAFYIQVSARAALRGQRRFLLRPQKLPWFLLPQSKERVAPQRLGKGFAINSESKMARSHSDGV